MGTVVDESLLVADSPGNTPDFITFSHIVETGVDLKSKEERYLLVVPEYLVSY